MSGGDLSQAREDFEEVLRALVRQALTSNASTHAETSLALLQSVTKSLSKLIGEQGTELLLLRVSHRVSDEYSWFRFSSTPHLDPTFTTLCSCLKSQESADALAASMLFFDTMIDLLASLVGGHLTTLILNSAFGGVSAGASSKKQGAE